MTRRPDAAALLEDGEDKDALIDEPDLQGRSRAVVHRKSSQRQTFLVGPTIYLRPLELAGCGTLRILEASALANPC